MLTTQNSLPKSDKALFTSKSSEETSEFNILNKETFKEPKTVETLIDEMLQQREDVNDGKPVNTEDAPLDAPELIPDDTPDKKDTQDDVITGISDKPKLSVKKARFEAWWIARNVNRLNAFGCGILANEDDEKFKADNDELKELMAVFYEWRKDSDEPLPLWLEIAISCVLVFGPKWKQAFDMRKYKIHIEEQNAKILILEKKLEKEKKLNEQEKEKASHRDVLSLSKQACRDEQNEQKKPDILIVSR